ncbi:disease resistance protein RGA2 [Gossypium hirsutum]|uniref:Disease resistance protein RGA2 n=1 Tax=Gossypium hirsutum TaxID=3635 RepID=A0A1U8ME52_GOSHI|nr:disease resistance protein RGA2-like [Gossypium hirsutum]
MAEAIAFDLAVELITKLSSFTLSQIGLWWHVKDDLDHLNSTVSTIKAVLLDAEERSVTSQLVKDWLEKLKYVLYDADDLLDDFSTEVLRKDLMGGNRLAKEWVSLKELLVGGAKGSRIIVITRSWRVAKITSKCQPYVLKGLSDDDAWSLLKEIAFEQRYADSTNSAFVEIRKQISKRCSGVPLVIRTIASTLSFKETENEWRSFKDNELARIYQNEGTIITTLKLSYDHLPSHLKHCFAYCRLYSKDHEIHVQTLVQFWVAQGFIKQLNRNQSLDEIGLGYFKDLVERSFFQEVEEDENWGMTYKMHDLMHDLAESVAGTESSIVDSNEIASEVGEKCHHISINTLLIPLVKGKKLRNLLQYPKMRTKNLSDETWDL